MHAFITFVLLAAGAVGAGDETRQRPRVQVQALPLHTHVAPGGSTAVAVRFTIPSGWHIYWADAGDAGVPTQVEIKAPKGVNVGPVTYSRPITIADPAAPDQPPAEIGRIKLAAWEGSPISKGLDGLFRVEGGGILPTDEAATVKVGSLEQSNVKTTEVLVDMIDAQRLFAMRSKVISTAREIDESGAQLMRLG